MVQKFRRSECRTLVQPCTSVGSGCAYRGERTGETNYQDVPTGGLGSPPRLTCPAHRSMWSDTVDCGLFHLNNYVRFTALHFGLINPLGAEVTLAQY